MLSVRSSGTHSSPPLCVWWILLDKRTNFVHQWSHGRGPRASVWLCCSSAVIWSVSCGILIESEVFHVNPETSGLPSRTRSESKGHSLVTFTQRTLERAKPHVVPFSSFLARLLVLQARLTMSQTQTGPQPHLDAILILFLLQTLQPGGRERS